VVHHCLHGETPASMTEELSFRDSVSVSGVTAQTLRGNRKATADEPSTPLPALSMTGMLMARMPALLNARTKAGNPLRQN
jgi:hypothetical protein